MSTFIQDQAEFERWLGALRSEALLAVDTEAASFHRHLDRIYLIQISSREATAVVDPLAVTDLRLLGEVLADPSIEIIFHDADYDLRILNRDYGFQAANLFDTRIAAQLLNEPGIGLAALLEKYLGVTLDKKFQRADWSLRPLLPGMLEYAAGDTHHLATLRDILREKLQTAGRWTWAEEEFTLLEGVRWTPPGPAEEAYLRMKGSRALKGRALLVLKEVYSWREALASRLDRAQFRVLGNDVLLGLAERPPADVQGLKTVKGISTDFVTKRGPDLFAAIQRGLEAPAASIPVFERSRRPPRDPEFDAALERLKVVRNQAATRLDLAPGVLCPNGALEAIARAKPKSVEEIQRLPEIRRWQAGAIGQELIQVLGAAS